MSPFDPRSALFAKHAQHVVLIHFPIALYLAGVAFDALGRWRKKPAFTVAAFYNLTFAAWFTVPAIATGFIAWQWQLEGQRLKGVLLYHLLAAAVSSVFIWTSWWLHWKERQVATPRPSRLRLITETVGTAFVALTGHLGGFLSGVNS